MSSLIVFAKQNHLANLKINPIFVYPGLRYAHKNLNFACKKNCLENICSVT